MLVTLRLRRAGLRTTLGRLRFARSATITWVGGTVERIGLLG